MTFIWPAMLLLLASIPLVVLAYLDWQQRRRKTAAKYGSLGFVQSGAGKGLGVRRHVPSLLFLAGVITLIVALARPQAVVSMPKVEGTVILAFDVSGSMSADDIQPSRMEAAKAAAIEFVDNQPSTVQIGVVAFSDSGLTVQAPTNEKDAILASISRLAPQRGTSLGHGIVASLSMIDDATKKALNNENNPDPQPTPTPVPKGTHVPFVVVLLTDGENNEAPDPLAAAQAAADRGVRVYTVGIGSPEGTNVHVNGFTVHTQLNQDMLQQISQLTDGTYYNAQSKEDLLKIYKELGSKLVIKPEKTEVTSVFAGASILILLAGGLLSLLWFSRLP